MGEPPGGEWIHGVPCDTCWGLGKTFGIGGTPEKVFITWSGLTGVLAPANKVFIGIQDAFNPCLYSFQDDTFAGSWFWTVIMTQSSIWVKIGGIPRVDTFGFLCALTCTAGAAKCIMS